MSLIKIQENIFNSTAHFEIVSGQHLIFLNPS